MVDSRRAQILGLGHYIPTKCVTNHDLAQIIDTSDEWIKQRTGIAQRYYVDFDKEPLSGPQMAARAARSALSSGNCSTSEVDCIIYATLSPTKGFPGDGVLLQKELDIPAGVAAFDIRNQCSGFLYGLQMAQAFIATGQYKRILLVGAEIHSTGLDFSNQGRDVAVLFGDGAAACLLGPSEGEAGVLTTCVHADGRFADELQVAYPSSAMMPRLDEKVLATGNHFPHMNGRLVFRHAVTRMPQAVLQALNKLDLSVKDINLFIPHQANLRIAEAVASALDLPSNKVYNNIMHYGNTTAASIPLAMSEAAELGMLERGHLLCLASFGAGFTWGAALIRY